jgi:hypothetical protein
MMIAKQFLIVLCVTLAAAGARAAETASRNAVNDSQFGATITYARNGGVTKFTAVMPQGWAFHILVDGNRDGKWGIAAHSGDSMMVPPSTANYAFGINTDLFFCAQYILAWDVANPEIAQAMSQCAARPSKGFFQASAPDTAKRVTTTYTIPDAELSGAQKDAAIAFEIWDKKDHHHYFSPAAPLVLPK